MVFLKSSVLLLLLIALAISVIRYEHRQLQQYHTQTAGLSWQYCRPRLFAQCPEPVLLDWGQALRYCAQLNWTDYQDWRLPNRSELLNLVNRQKRTPAITEVLANNTKDNVYWSSNTDSDHPELAYYISFFSGNSYANSKQVHAYVRCVR
ncbi:DUF1566 domain-containing protein [Methyloprofundus sp.]|uniref:Lcl C-terminal domain-containing protein n=1 Tax=Methyloprofundus sp. TaxID=2020875 RepID=UPI003D12FDFE